jgi:hypothetical protein
VQRYKYRGIIVTNRIYWSKRWILSGKGYVGANGGYCQEQDMLEQMLDIVRERIYWSKRLKDGANKI